MVYVAVNVFDDDNGGVDEQSQGQDESKQSDAVDGLSCDEAGGQYHEQDERHGEGYDAGFTPAQKKHQNDNHRTDGDAQMFH